MDNNINYDLINNSFLFPKDRDNKDNRNTKVSKNLDEQLNPNKLIGMCYVPMQEWEQTYDEDTAFSVGTLFPSLNKPFYGGGK